MKWWFWGAGGRGKQGHISEVKVYKVSVIRLKSSGFLMYIMVTLVNTVFYTWNMFREWILCWLFLFAFCFVFRAAPVAYGGSQTRGWIGAVAAGLHHSHSNAKSELHLQPTPQLMAMPDPYTEQGQGLNLCPHGCWSDLFLLNHDRNSWTVLLKTV